MMATARSRTWDDRRKNGGRFKRGFWNTVYYLGRFFSAFLWNPYQEKKVPQEVKKSSTTRNSREERSSGSLLHIEKPKVQLTLFNPVTDLEKLLQYVAYGQQKQAEELIKTNPTLLLEKGTVIDYSKREFKGITAFQYALWALDRHMWEMIRQYLPEEQQAIQLTELKTHATKHGTHFDFGPLQTALKNYVEYTREHYHDLNKANHTWQFTKAKELWLKIGQAQRDVPAHLAQQYCSKTDFSTPSLERTLKISNDKQKEDVWFPLENSKLGTVYSIIHTPRGAMGLDMKNDSQAMNLYGGQRIGDIDVAAEGIATLVKTRTDELTALGRDLGVESSSQLGLQT